MSRNDLPPRTFSTRDDFNSYFVANGESPLGDYLDPRWFRIALASIEQGATGCLFAQHRAQRRLQEQSTWLPITLPWPLQSHSIEYLQRILMSASQAEAVMVLCPDVREIAQLAKLLKTLAMADGWAMAENIPPSPVDEEVLVGLRWTIPNTIFVSEILAFGEFPSLPPTRQAPVTYLVFRARSPVGATEDNHRVHLAQMPLLEMENRRTDPDGQSVFWERTSQRRSEMLHESSAPYAAKAKVTAIFPREVWEKE